MGKLHSPRHGDEPRARPRFEAVARAAAPGGTHEASLPFATNRTAPVQAESCAAVQETGAAEESGNGVTAGGGIAGIAEAAGVPRPGCSTGGVAASARDTGCVPSGGGAPLPSPEAPPDSPGAPERTVLHVDIDAFFAAIEQRRDPRLAGRPVIVGAGVIASCSYEARAFGLKAGMPLSEARRLCPRAVILEGHAQARTLRSMNRHTIGDLRALSAPVLESLFGANGRLFHDRCRGRDTAPVNEREIPLSISRETSFHRDTADRVEIEGMLEYLVGRACRASRELAIRARTVSVRLRYADGEGLERARSLRMPSDADPVALALALDLLRALFTRRVALHAVGGRAWRRARAAARAAPGSGPGPALDEPHAPRRARAAPGSGPGPALDEPRAVRRARVAPCGAPGPALDEPRAAMTFTPLRVR